MEQIREQLASIMQWLHSERTCLYNPRQESNHISTFFKKIYEAKQRLLVNMPILNLFLHFDAGLAPILETTETDTHRERRAPRFKALGFEFSLIIPIAFAYFDNASFCLR